MNDLDFLRELMKDDRLHVGVGTITQLGPAKDGSILRVQINLLPENREVIGEMTFADVFSVTFPEIDDLVLVLFVDGHPDECYVVKTINTVEEKIPLFALLGHSVAYSRLGKKLYLGSDTKVAIGRSTNLTDLATSPLVLGDVLLTYLVALEGRLEGLINAITSNVPLTTTPGNPVNAAPLLAALVPILLGLKQDKATYLLNAGTNIASQISFTQR
jgi:hypothetical protein